MYFQQIVKKTFGRLPCMSSIALLMFSVPNTQPTAMHSENARIRIGMFIPEEGIIIRNIKNVFKEN